MPFERVAHCLRTPRAGAVEVLHVPGRRSGVFKGLQTCGSVWHDAVCQAKISERRRVELSEAMERSRAEGWRFFLASYTVRHQRADDLVLVLAGLKDARRRHRSGAWSEAARAVVAASVRALEVTHGVNGWHPHLHDILGVAPGVEFDEGELARDLGERWAVSADQAARKVGVDLAVNGHGFKLTRDQEAIADYVTKLGRPSTWSLAHEVTKQVVKRGRVEGSRTPTDLLWLFLAGDDDAGRLWQVYAYVFKGQNQLVWSPGGRVLLGLGVEKSDDELAAEVSEQAVLMALLTLPEWRVILGNDLRAELLTVAGRGVRAEVLEWVTRVTK